MPHIEIAIRDGFQVIRMQWTKQIPGFQRHTFDLVRQALQEADENPAVSSSVFLGTPSCFCLGTDAQTFAAAEGMHELSATVRSFFRQLISARKPLIAAVDGNAVGLGMTMLLHFDAVFATPKSTFRAPFAEWGLVPEAASSLLLPERLGYLRAFDVFCLGGTLASEQALACGLLTRIESSDTVEEVAFRTARQIAKLPPRAMLATRNLLRGNSATLNRRAATETAMFQELLADAATQRRLKTMSRAARMVLAT